MEETKLTVRIPRQVLEDAKRYAREHNTTVTRLVSHYLRQVSTAGHPLAEAPIVRRLSGTLPEDLTIHDYRRHLEAKYGREA